MTLSVRHGFIVESGPCHRLTKYLTLSQLLSNAYYAILLPKQMRT
jgi:hypothetical protein